MSGKDIGYERYKEESQSSRFAHKAKENPAMSGGIALGAGVLAYMAWGLSHRQPGEKLSVYLIHSRMAVQGTIIGCLSAAMTFQVYKDHVAPLFHKKD